MIKFKTVWRWYESKNPVELQLVRFLKLTNNMKDLILPVLYDRYLPEVLIHQKADKDDVLDASARSIAQLRLAIEKIERSCLRYCGVLPVSAVVAPTPAPTPPPVSIVENVDDFQFPSSFGGVGKSSPSEILQNEEEEEEDLDWDNDDLVVNSPFDLDKMG